MTYQRGTDLKHCPDGCEGLVWNEIPECSVANDYNFICPREQAEKPAETCGNCSRYNNLLCDIDSVFTTAPSRCYEWKERTNG